MFRRLSLIGIFGLLLTLSLYWQVPHGYAEPQNTASNTSSQNSNKAQVMLLDLKPSDQELLDQASKQQKQKEYAAALQLLTDLLQFYPESKLADDALFQIAECYKNLGRFEDARKSMQLLREKYPDNRYKEASTLLEAEMLAMDKKYGEASQKLEALTESKEKQIQLRALYILALIQQESNAKNSSQPILEKILTHTEENPYRSFALLELGKLEERKDTAKALNYFEEAIKNAEPNSREKWNASLHAAYILMGPNQDKWKEAAELCQSVWENKDAPSNLRSVAYFGLMQSCFNLREYARVIELSHQRPSDFPKNLTSPADLFAAEAYRLSGQSKPALELYAKIIAANPKEEIAATSAWNVVALLYKEHDPRAIEKLESFIKEFKESPQIPQAWLMLAERFFEQKEFKRAADTYASMLENKITEKLEPDTHAPLLLHWAEALWHIKDYEFSSFVLTQFLNTFKDNPKAPDAAWLLAQNQLTLGKKEAALETLELFMTVFPEDKRRENATWQAALVALDLKKHSIAQNDLEELIEKYPKTKHLTQASLLLASSLAEQKKFKQAKPWWQKVRALDPAQYTELATQHLIQIAVQMEDINELMTEISSYDQFKKAKPSAPAISTDTIEWLAQKLARASRFEEAERYYQRALESTQDSKQRKRIFLTLAQLQMDQKKWPQAVQQWKIYRLNYPEDANKNVILESLAKACIGMGELEEANRYAEQILKQSIEGTWNAKGRMLLGEIAFAQQKYEEAAKIYSAVALLIDDPEITPFAKSKALEAKSMIQNVETPQ